MRIPGFPVVPATTAAMAALMVADLACGQAPDRLSGPLPVDVAASVQGHNGRAPIGFSPDGRWLAHTVATNERVARDSIASAYTATGVTLADGDARMEATVTNTSTGERIRLGAGGSSSWAPVWSPDGNRIAFYSDEDGEAGLWIWERDTRRARRLGEVIVRPFFGFEGPRWCPDGGRLLVKALPKGVTVAEANARDPLRPGVSRFPPVEPGDPSVLVRRAGWARQPDVAPSEPQGPLSGLPDGRRLDLVEVEAATGRVARVAEAVPVAYYAWSPSGRSVAYTIATGILPNSLQVTYDLVVRDLGDRGVRTLASDVLLAYGMEWHWSPEGSSLSWVSSGSMGTGPIHVVSLSDGETIVSEPDLPDFGRAGEYPPVWSPDGASILSVGDGEVWQIDPRTGRGERVAGVPGWRIVAIASPFEEPSVLAMDEGRTLRVLARGSGGRSAILAVDLEARSARLVLEEDKTYRWAPFQFTGSRAAGLIAFLSTDLHNPEDLWLLETGTGEVRPGTRLNDGLDRYELGSAELIEWRGPEGRPLRGALLLPPDHSAGEGLPLVVWVYGGSMGSNSVNQFGLLMGSMPVFNWHVLATRGYAVLVPDAPLREGRVAEDLLATVIPGVDAAIKKGYADPDRLAVMGQSYGAFNTLSLITGTNRFQAAVITGVVTHPDLFADYLRWIGYYEQGQGRMAGSIWEYPERYFENSPLFRFDRIGTPVLIGQGEWDRDLIAVDAVFAALERLDKPVEYRLYESEGHVITRAANVIDFWERRLEFLAEQLDLKPGPDGRVTPNSGRPYGLRP